MSVLGCDTSNTHRVFCLSVEKMEFLLVCCLSTLPLAAPALQPLPKPQRADLTSTAHRGSEQESQKPLFLQKSSLSSLPTHFPCDRVWEGIRRSLSVRHRPARWKGEQTGIWKDLLRMRVARCPSGSLPCGVSQSFQSRNISKW